MKTRVESELRGLLKSKRKRRDKKYVHRRGEFTLTANFRNPDRTRIALVGALVQYFTQASIADMLGTSTSTVGKMVRVFYAGHRP